MATRSIPGGRAPTRDSTELSVVPAISDEPSQSPTADGAVFEEPWAEPGAEPGSSEVSVIEAVEDPPSASADPDATGELAASPDRAPTEVMRLAFSGMGPPDLEDGAEPREVRSVYPGAPQPNPTRAPAAGSAAFAVADTQQMKRPGTRGDTELDAVQRASADLKALARDLEEVDRMLRAVKTAAGGLPLEAARGLNAQLASALHRLAAARSRLE